MSAEKEQLASKLVQIIQQQNAIANAKLLEEFLAQSKSGTSASSIDRPIRSR